MKDDTVSRAAVMQSLTAEYNRRRTGDGLKLAWIEKAVNDVPAVQTCEDAVSRQAAIDVIEKIFPADPMRNDYTQGITCGAALAAEYIKQLPVAQQETHEKRTETHACDLIDRQAATTIPVMPKEHRHYQTFNLDDAYEQGWYDLQECIENLPAVQPQEIIRCKDCIYYRWEIDMCDRPYSTAHNLVHEDDYCSRAERRTDG